MLVAGTANGVLRPAGSIHAEAPLLKTQADHANKNRLDESFFDMLMRCQVLVVVVHSLVDSSILLLCTVLSLTVLGIVGNIIIIIIIINN